MESPFHVSGLKTAVCTGCVWYTMLMGFRWRSIVLIPESFLQELGAMCGTVTKALHKIPLRTLDRRLLWEMHNVQDTLNEYLTWIKDKKLRNQVSRSLDLYKRTMETS